MDIQQVINDKRFQIGVAAVVGFGLGYLTGSEVRRRATPVVIPPEPLGMTPALQEKFDELTEKFESISKDTDVVSELNDPDLVVVNDIEDPILEEAASIVDKVRDQHIPAEVVLEERTLSHDEVVERGLLVEEVDPPDIEEHPLIEERTVRNVFDNPISEEWNMDREASKRSKDAPYIIHLDEYMTHEQEDFTQHTFTYYAGDDVLVDDTETPIHNYKARVGELRFGHGSHDPNVVYIRNHDLEEEYEILRTEERYTEVVLGLEVEETARRKDERREALTKFRDD